MNLNEKEEIKKERYNELSKSAVKIKEYVNKNLEIFGIDLRNESNVKDWYSYLCYVDDIVFKSILQTVATSLSYLLEETDPKKNPSPLFDLQLALCEPEIIFKPSIEKDMVGNFFDITNAIIEDIFHMATLVPRVAFRKDFPKYVGKIHILQLL